MQLLLRSFVLAFFVFFSFSVLTGCGSDVSTGDERVSFLDGKFSVSKPALWGMMTDLNDSADLQMGNLFKEAYTIILSENKADFDQMTLREHSDITRGLLQQGITGYKESSPEKLNVNGYDALRYELSGSVGNINVIYWHVTIETDSHYHQILLWSLNSRFSDNKEDFEKVIYSFKENK